MSKKSQINRREFLEITGAAAAYYLLAGDQVLALTRDTKIVRAAIHPGIGIARVGTSAEEYFIGPEVIDAPYLENARDSSGALKRQAARFRIYGYNAAGQVVRELTSIEADIEWEVHLANKKSQWYCFDAALDLPESEGMRMPRRNDKLKGGARKSLAIDPGPKKILGKKASQGVKLDGGKFLDTAVSLGELRTDPKGRLMVLPAQGKAGSPTGKPVYDPANPASFNNADGWWDDIGDGPVRARLRLKGAKKEIPVESAWVVVAPPNYAPDIVSFRTLYDLLYETHVASGLIPKPATTSFTRDIYPLLQRLSNLQWVNQGFAQTFGKGTRADFESLRALEPLAIVPLSQTTDTTALVRKEVHQQFRLKEKANPKDRHLWPMLYGDAEGTWEGTPRINFTVGEVAALHLKRWREGNFINDWDPKKKQETKVDRLPVAQQPAMLDRAALHYCLADAFHPGCELTYPMRHASLYGAPFRVKQKNPGAGEQDYGDLLSPETLRQKDGPLHAQGPGDLTKWMAIPWHGDTVGCRSGYEPEIDPYLPTFWPARVPNHVLTYHDYKIVMNTSLSRAERLAAFKRRADWTRPLHGGFVSQIHQMIDDYGMLGVLEPRPGFPDDPDFPAVLFVENAGAEPVGAPMEAHPKGRGRTRDGARSADPVTKAGWESREQLAEFRRARIRKRK